MTDKSKHIVIGKGRFHFDGGLRKPRAIGKARELGMGYSVSATSARDAYRDVYHEVVVVWLVGHNPQRLLTDQRSPEKKIEDSIRRAMGEYIDGLAMEMLFPIPDFDDFANGGVVTGRWSGRSITPIGYAGEYIVSRYRKD